MSINHYWQTLCFSGIIILFTDRRFLCTGAGTQKASERTNAMIHIKQDGTGDFTSVQAALDSLPADNQEPVTLFIHKGIYREQIHVTVPYVSFTGESAEKPS